MKAVQERKKCKLTWEEKDQLMENIGERNSIYIYIYILLAAFLLYICSFSDKVLAPKDKMLQKLPSNKDFKGLNAD